MGKYKGGALSRGSKQRRFSLVTIAESVKWVEACSLIPYLVRVLEIDVSRSFIQSGTSSSYQPAAGTPDNGTLKKSIQPRPDLPIQPEHTGSVVAFEDGILLVSYYALPSESIHVDTYSVKSFSTAFYRIIRSG